MRAWMLVVVAVFGLGVALEAEAGTKTRTAKKSSTMKTGKQGSSGKKNPPKRTRVLEDRQEGRYFVPGYGYTNEPFRVRNTIHGPNI